MKVGDKLKLRWFSMSGNVTKKEWSEFAGAGFSSKDYDDITPVTDKDISF